MSEPYFVTGALGCIGAWVVKALVERGDAPVVFDLSDDRRRLGQVLDGDALEGVRFVRGDITDLAAVRSALERSGARRVVHLAGLQVPFCRADPALGARVNVVGTVNVFEAAKELGLERVVYASSAAVYGPRTDGESDAPDESDACEPTTHYGVFKRANEGTARIFWQDDGVASIGLRPLTVYGVGRDQGLTSGPTRAMKAAVLGRAYTIPFRGATDLNFAGDTAAAFLACADRGPDGAHVFNLHGDSVDVAEIVAGIEHGLGELGLDGAGARIAVDGPELPIPPELDGSALERALPGLPRTPLLEGILATMERFSALRARGTLDASDLEG